MDDKNEESEQQEPPKTTCGSQTKFVITFNNREQILDVTKNKLNERCDVMVEHEKAKQDNDFFQPLYSDS